MRPVLSEVEGPDCYGVTDRADRLTAGPDPMTFSSFPCFPDMTPLADRHWNGAGVWRLTTRDWTGDPEDDDEEEEEEKKKQQEEDEEEEGNEGEEEEVPWQVRRARMKTEG